MDSFHTAALEIGLFFIPVRAFPGSFLLFAHRDRLSCTWIESIRDMIELKPFTIVLVSVPNRKGSFVAHQRATFKLTELKAMIENSSKYTEFETSTLMAFLTLTRPV